MHHTPHKCDTGSLQAQQACTGLLTSVTQAACGSVVVGGLRAAPVQPLAAVRPRIGAPRMTRGLPSD